MNTHTMREPILHPAPMQPKLSLIEGFKHCAVDLDLDPISHLKEIMRMGRQAGRVSLRDHFYYRLFDQTLSETDRARFVGSRLERTLHRFVFDPQSHHLATDKCLFESTLRKAGFPTPQTLCLFQKKGDATSSDFLRVETTHDLDQWLQSAVAYPLFGKPRTGIRSGGVLSLSACDPVSKQISTHIGDELDAGAIAASLKPYRRRGYLFQRRLRPHPRVAQIVGDAIATVRLVLLVKSKTTSVYRAAWKLPAHNNAADNFWRGNVLAGLDPDTGEVLRSIIGIGLDMRPVTHHPNSGRPILGARVPEWKTLVNLCIEASRHIAGIDMQAWDVAVTDSGPVLMEVNIGGDYNLPQLALNKGMLEREFIDFLEECAQRRNSTAKFNRLKLNQIDMGD